MGEFVTAHDRRYFLRTSGLAMLGFGVSPLFLRRALAAAEAPRKKVLVTVFQRGAVDGLSMIPPVAEGRYYDLRPNLAIAPPGKGDDAALRLDDTFGLHPALGPLGRFWDAGSLAVVHAAGSPDPSRSHFDAQDALDAGTPGSRMTPDGWLNRALAAEPRPAGGPFRAISLSPNLQRSLAGREPALAMASVADYAVRPGTNTAAAAASFERLYAGASDPALRTAAGETFDSVRRLREANPSRFSPRNGAVYPTSELGRRMKEIAQLICADVGLEVAATDSGGWDTHAGQGGAKGRLAIRLKDLGDALVAFATDLGDGMANVCVVTMTEFGRTVKENGTRGTDHGHGSVMLVLGGAVKGRRVVARWKGLREQDLFEGRDLPVTTDHREVLSDVLTAHLGITRLSTVFPGFVPPAPPGLF